MPPRVQFRRTYHETEEAGFRHCAWKNSEGTIMRIAFILPANVIRGGIFVAYQQAHHLASQGHEVSILFVSGQAGLKVGHYPGFSLKTELLQAAVENDQEYDVIFATWWETYYEMFMLRSHHYLYFCQSDERRFYPSRTSFEVPFVEKTYCNKKIGIVTEAKWIKDWLQNDYGLMVEYAPNGIDNQLFNPNVKPLEPKGKALRVLIEGSGALPYKRVDLAFRVANRIKEIEVWYISTGGIDQPHWEFTRKFAGVPYGEMPSIYRSCDILLKLSTVEGFFGPPLEMMACGGTAVVTKVTGFDEYIQDEVNALAVGLDDEEATYRALTRLVEDADLRMKLSHNAIATAQSMDWKDRSPLFEQAMSRLIERTSAISIQERTEIRVMNELRKQSARLARLLK
jgi:glycosyltransferase involved in cell wall biosynthesis